jgi:O-antigen/teichoic acid export membrane protein
LPYRLLNIFDKVTPGASRSLGWEILLTALLLPASILVNRTLGAEDRGLFSLVMLVPSTVITLGTCQWDKVVRGLITSKQISSKEAWRRTVYYSYWLSLLFIPFSLIASFAYTRIPLEERLIGALYSFNFPFFILSGSLSAIYIAAGSIDGQYSMRIAYQGSYFILVLGLRILGWLSVPSLVLIYIAIWIISFLVGWIKKEKILNGLTFLEKPRFSPLVQSFLPYSLETLSLSADTWAFSIFGSLTTLGHYIGITGLMQPVGLVSNALTSASTSRLDWTNPLVVKRYLFKSVATMLCLLVGLVIGGILLGSYLLTWVLGRSFAGGEWMIPLIGGIVISKAIAAQFHFALQLSGLGNAYLIIQTVEPLLRLGLLLILGWQLSELGILIGMILSSIIKCLVCFLFINKQKIRFLKLEIN